VITVLKCKEYFAVRSTTYLKILKNILCCEKAKLVTLTQIKKYNTSAKRLTR